MADRDRKVEAVERVRDGRSSTWGGAAMGGKPVYDLPEGHFKAHPTEEGLISFLDAPEFWDRRRRAAPRPPRGRIAPKVHWSM